MKILCVAEKPSISKSVAEILSNRGFRTRQSGNRFIKNYDFSCIFNDDQMVEVTMTAVSGHLMKYDFAPEYRKWDSCAPLVLFQAPIIKFVGEENRQIKDNLYHEAQRADQLMIWTDCDREGENIGSEIASICEQAKRGIRITRARFSAIIPDQIFRAWRRSVGLDMNQSDAVDARIELDLRIGAAFTRYQTLSIQHLFPELQKQVISYGSCQFPTLGFVVDQHHKVGNFIPEEFWKIQVALEKEEILVEFHWERNHLFDKEICFVIYEQCALNPMATVVEVISKETKKWKPYPLTTIELQKVATRALRMSSDRIMAVAEDLYNKGYISYPRTETNQFDNNFDLRHLIEKQVDSNDWGDFARGLLEDKFKPPRRGNQNDKAHPPIHPTAYVSNLTREQKQVYDFIVRRFLACCSDDAIGHETAVKIQVHEEKFAAKGLVILETNYLDVYPFDQWTGTFLPDFQQGEQIIPTSCEMKDGQTTSPEYLTETELISIMDQNGIGTDATIHEHIAKILERNYITKENRGNKTYIIPQPLGIALVEGYDSIGFEMSLSKPYLRRQENVVTESLVMYKEMFVKSNQEQQKLIRSVQTHLRDNVNRNVATNAITTTNRATNAVTTTNRRSGGRGSRGGRRNGRGGRGRAG
ncbi:3439_t:CDS:10 [Entrophospora sp. SA101]|nr:13234_t:CDS:10 [Entrophospora sp. SA101]CAJ0648607.1 10979_t:CDS:10 [Entrophospora sp. SA101]CAJ0751272.1 19496_t:CDS:10 [Entrophospora sp. SA101]CAJ0759843.1 3439_t:CDS:10 [Entrophospora sp. SA101]CAJ0857710.1 10183_t:CDS:10 [Entrophospora sp. SA101]